jgi:hypothetical protein
MHIYALGHRFGPKGTKGTKGFTLQCANPEVNPFDDRGLATPSRRQWHQAAVVEGLLDDPDGFRADAEQLEQDLFTLAGQLLHLVIPGAYQRPDRGLRHPGREGILRHRVG